ILRPQRGALLPLRIVATFIPVVPTRREHHTGKSPFRTLGVVRRKWNGADSILHTLYFPERLGQRTIECVGGAEERDCAACDPPSLRHFQSCGPRPENSTELLSGLFTHEGAKK